MILKGFPYEREKANFASGADFEYFRRKKREL